jgi:hypothetical protein
MNIAGKLINRGIFMLGTLLKWIKKDNGDTLAKLGKLYEGDRGINDLTENEAVLRLWLPETLKRAMDEAMAAMEVTASKYLREFFVVYLYGAHELLRMQAEKTGLYYVPPPAPSPQPSSGDALFSGGPLFSRAAVVDCIPGLGKNIVPVKIYIPQKIKADLELLAKHVEVPLSRFTRELLVSHFLGHTVWPARIAGWTPDQERTATDWENGEIEEQGFLYYMWLEEEKSGNPTSTIIETM